MDYTNPWITQNHELHRTYKLENYELHRYMNSTNPCITQNLQITKL